MQCYSNRLNSISESLLLLHPVSCHLFIFLSSSLLDSCDKKYEGFKIWKKCITMTLKKTRKSIKEEGEDQWYLELRYKIQTNSLQLLELPWEDRKVNGVIRIMEFFLERFHQSKSEQNMHMCIYTSWVLPKSLCPVHYKLKSAQWGDRWHQA